MESDMHSSFGSHDKETKRIKALSDHVDFLPQRIGHRIGHDHSNRISRIDKVLVDGIFESQYTPNLCTDTQRISL